MFYDLMHLINEIGRLHQQFSKDFFVKCEAYNLKQSRVDNVIFAETYDEKFISLVEEYIENISEWVIYLVFESENPLLDTRFRVKNRGSSLNKLTYYRHGKVNPSIPLQKCMNDLLGFRIIIAQDFDYRELLNQIQISERLETSLFRPYVRTDEEYQGIHIYFKNDNNKYFPWELQIWKKSDTDLNEKAHRTHKEKRKYMSWAEMYEGSKHREE